MTNALSAENDRRYLTPSGEISAEGIRRVRIGLIDPLIERGMRKSKSRDAEAHEKWLNTLARALAYLDPKFYPALSEAIQINAVGKRRNTWPEMVTITNFARAYQKPPAHLSPMIVRYMRSQAGRDAWARGELHALALFRYLRRANKPPLGEGAWLSIRRDAEDLSSQRSWWQRDDHVEVNQSKLKAIAGDIVSVRALVFPGEVPQ